MITRSSETKRRTRGDLLEAGVWKFSDLSDEELTHLAHCAGTAGRTKQLQDFIVLVATKWAQDGVTPLKQPALSDAAVDVLTQLSSALKSMDRIRLPEGWQDILKVMSPHWDGSWPFYFSDGAEHSVVWIGEFASRIDEKLAKKEGHPRTDELRTSQAVDRLVEAWVSLTRRPPRWTTGRQSHSISAFYNTALSKLTWQRLEGTYDYKAVRIIPGDAGKFSRSVMAGLKRGIGRWSDSVRHRSVGS